MKVAPADAERFAGQPPAAIRAVLVYGPDEGLVRERVGRLLASVVEDAHDPFRVAELGGGELAKDPARLADEAAAMALTGGRRVVRVREPGDSLAPLFKDFLADPPGDAPGSSPGQALVLLEAGDLPARSALRKVFEGAKQGAALACYRDDARSLPALIRAALAAEGLTASRDALAYLAASLGGDRQITRRELEKLALYKGPGNGPGGGEVSLEDAMACVGDSAALSLDDLVYAAADGHGAALERAINRSLAEGATAVGLLRAAANHFQRLHLAAGLMRQGLPAKDALRKLRPPPFWKLAPRFEAQARAWSPAGIARVMERLIEAEAACKRTGAPDEALASRALHAIAAAAPGRRR